MLCVLGVNPWIIMIRSDHLNKNHAMLNHVSNEQRVIDWFIYYNLKQWKYIQIKSYILYIYHTRTPWSAITLQLLSEIYIIGQYFRAMEQLAINNVGSVTWSSWLINHIKNWPNPREQWALLLLLSIWWWYGNQPVRHEIFFSLYAFPSVIVFYLVLAI